MSRKEDLEARIAPLSQEAEELFKSWPQLAQQDLHTVLGKFFGLTFKMLGVLADAAVDLAADIDASFDH